MHDARPESRNICEITTITEVGCRARESPHAGLFQGRNQGSAGGLEHVAGGFRHETGLAPVRVTRSLQVLGQVLPVRAQLSRTVAALGAGCQTKLDQWPLKPRQGWKRRTERKCTNEK